MRLSICSPPLNNPFLPRDGDPEASQYLGLYLHAQSVIAPHSFHHRRSTPPLLGRIDPVEGTTLLDDAFEHSHVDAVSDNVIAPGGMVGDVIEVHVDSGSAPRRGRLVLEAQ